MLKTDVAQLLLEKYGKKNPPVVKAGDTVRVHQKIREGEKERVQIFEGLVIAVKHGRGLNGTFVVRKISVGGVGVERTYPLHSPNVVKVERVKTAAVSRAKLYYMRDRKGKNARFKNESANAMSWSEPAAVELPIEEEVPAEAIADEEVVEAVADVVEEQAEVAAEAEAETPEEVVPEEPVKEEPADEPEEEAKA
jgi:large subunit ribosomal protein L19